MPLVAGIRGDRYVDSARFRPKQAAGECQYTVWLYSVSTISLSKQQHIVCKIEIVTPKAVASLDWDTKGTCSNCGYNCGYITEAERETPYYSIT